MMKQLPLRRLATTHPYSRLSHPIWPPTVIVGTVLRVPHHRILIVSALLRPLHSERCNWTELNWTAQFSSVQFSCVARCEVVLQRRATKIAGRCESLQVLANLELATSVASRCSSVQLHRSLCGDRRELLQAVLCCDPVAQALQPITDNEGMT